MTYGLALSSEAIDVDAPLVVDQCAVSEYHRQR